MPRSPWSMSALPLTGRSQPEIDLLRVALRRLLRCARPTALAKPECDSQADQQDGPQQVEDDGLLQPGYRWDRQDHRHTEESDLRQQKTDAREERAERK